MFRKLPYWKIRVVLNLYQYSIVCIVTVLLGIYLIFRLYLLTYILRTRLAVLSCFILS